MASSRKQGGEIHHQMGNGQSSSFKSNRKPPMFNRHSPVPAWEKKFCFTVGLIPWGKIIECKKYMNMHPNVKNWEASAAREALDDAKRRFWAEMNGIPCDIPLPDPDMFIDDVDWNSIVDPELFAELEKARFDEEKIDVTGSLCQIRLEDIRPTGWDIDEEEEKPPHPLSVIVAQGCGYDYDECKNMGVDSWEQNFAPAEPAEEYEWQHHQNENEGANSWEQHVTPVQPVKEYEWQNCQNENEGANTWEEHFAPVQPVKEYEWQKNEGANSWEEDFAPVQPAKEYEWQHSQNENNGLNSWEQHYPPAEPPKENDWPHCQNENKGVNSWEQHYSPVEPLKEYEWPHSQNGNKGVNSWEQHYPPAEPLKEYGWPDCQNENKGVNNWEQHFAPIEPPREYEWSHFQNENKGVKNSWEQHYPPGPVEPPKEYDWQNDSRRQYQRERFGGDSHNSGKGRAGGNENGNWGEWDGGYNRRENKTNNRGRGNNRGRRRGSFGYVDKVTTAWQVKT